MFKKYLYDTVLDMVGFEDRNRAMYLSKDGNAGNDGTNPNDDDNESEAGLSGSRSGPHKRSDIYTDAPYIALPFKKLPKSSIVSDGELTNAQKAHALYRKYIRNGADHQINISGGLRIQFDNMMAHEDKWLKQNYRRMDIGALADMFDECNDVNVGLMGHAFIRFKRTAEWMKVVESIRTKQSIDLHPDDEM